MVDSHKLSLRTAVLINLNIMVGFGIFINTVLLAKQVGFLGFTCYAFVAVLMIPLILSMAALIRMNPLGNFYSYAAQSLGSMAGFLSTWIYFTAKLASATLIIHVSVKLAQSIIPSLHSTPRFFIETIIILLFAFLNTFHLRVGGTVAALFIILKITALSFAILSGFYLFTNMHTVPLAFDWLTLPATLPFVLYTFTGFEASCSMSRHIQDSQRNGPRAIIISFILAIIINTLYQFFFFVATKGTIAQCDSYLGAFPTLLHALIPLSPKLAHTIVTFLHLGIAASALGGSYGILLSNQWNLQTLAHHGHLFFSPVFTKLNHYGIPTACVIVEACLCIGYLLLTKGNQAPLQQLGALGSTVAYTLSVLGLIAIPHKLRKTQSSRLLPWLALGSCTLFIASCIKNFIHADTNTLLFFTVIVSIGLGMYGWLTHLKRHQRKQAQY
jgi:amino acid transporter